LSVSGFMLYGSRVSQLISPEPLKSGRVTLKGPGPGHSIKPARLSNFGDTLGVLFSVDDFHK
jgi:hypothetical protein